MRPARSRAPAAAMIALALSAVAPAAAAEDAAAASDDGRNVVSAIADVLDLRRSRSDDDANVGAQFSFVRTVSDDAPGASAVYNTDFYLTGDLNKAFNLQAPFTLGAFAEGHVSSEKTAAEDVWRFGGGLQYYHTIAEPLDAPSVRGRPYTLAERFHVEGLLFKVDGELDADRDFRTEQVLVDAAATVNMFNLGIGRKVPTPPAGTKPGTPRPVEFYWRPWVGAHLGQTVKGGNDADEPDTVFRIYGRAEGRLRFNFKGLEGVLDGVDLFAQDTVYALLNVDGIPTRNLLVTGVEFRLNEYAGVQVAYTIGREVPEFKKVETLEIGFSLRF